MATLGLLSSSSGCRACGGACDTIVAAGTRDERRGCASRLEAEKSVLLRALQQEIRRHDFSCFVDQPPSVAQGGKGVVVPGCPTCKKRINTMNQFVDHLAEDAMPALIEKLSTESKCEAIENPGSQ